MASPPVRIAAIDIGTLTIRLAVAEVEPTQQDFRLIQRQRAITHLGQGLVGTGNLAPEPMSRSLQVLAEYAHRLKQCNVTATRAVATAAVRQARNRQVFLDQAARQTGLAIELLTPHQEAQLSLDGVLSALKLPPQNCATVVVFDVGGGSTEWAWLAPGHKPVFSSLPLGASILTQTWINGDPPSAASLVALQAEVQRQLKQLPEPYDAGTVTQGQLRLVGTAGTVTTLAAMQLKMVKYDPDRINNLVLRRATVDHLVRRLANLPETERARLPGLEPAKAGVIVAGALIIQGILEFFQKDRLIVIDAGLLEGILLQLVKEIRPEFCPGQKYLL